MTMTMPTRSNGAAGSTDLVPRNTLAVAPLADLVPRSVEEAVQYAKMFAGSGMFAARTTESAFTILLTGMELGLGPAQAMRAFHVIEGKPSPSADALVALCLRHRDICKYFTPITSTAKEATFETLRAGAPAAVRTSYTIEDAQKAGLVGKKNWRENPAQMLIARCKSKLARMVYEDLTLGLYTPDELRDPFFMEQNLVSGEIVSDEIAEAEAYAEEAASLKDAINAVILNAKSDAGLYAGLKAKKNEMVGKAKLSDIDNDGLRGLLSALAEVALPSGGEAIEGEYAQEEARAAADENDAAVAAGELEADMKARLAEEGDPFADSPE